MTQPDKIVMPDDPEAATLMTVTGWVSRHGRFYGDDERTARYDGSTHFKCSKCGELLEKRSYCQRCLDIADEKRFDAMPRAKWDGVAMLYSQALDEYFNDMEGVYDALDTYSADCEEEKTLADLQLIVCEPNRGDLLDESYFHDAMSTEDDQDLPDEYHEAIEAFNDAIAKCPVLSWSPGKFALEVEPEDASDSAPDDGANGMVWWNSLTEAERARWLAVAGSAVPADAWAAYKRQRATPEGL